MQPIKSTATNALMIALIVAAVFVVTISSTILPIVFASTPPSQNNGCVNNGGNTQGHVCIVTQDGSRRR